MKTKISTVFLAFFIMFSDIVYADALSDFINRVLENNIDYQQAVQRLQNEKAIAMISNSTDFGSINFSYQDNDNSIEREEFKSSLESSEIDETDERWKIEYTKQFFPMDYDETDDVLNSKISALRYEQNLFITNIECVDDIIDDLINWYEAEQKMEIYQEKKAELLHENLLLVELSKDNINDPDKLIKNLKKIDKLEKELANLQENKEIIQAVYGDILAEFLTVYRSFMESNSAFQQQTFSWNAIKLNENLDNRIEKISKSIKIHSLYRFLPEINLSFSYQWRETEQDWLITDYDTIESMKRTQIEHFPEGKIELSIPLNFFSNIKGKSMLIHSYKKELKFRKKEMNNDLTQLMIKRKNSFDKAKQSYERNTAIYQLQQQKMNSTQQQYNSEPTLLGNTPESFLKMEKLETFLTEVEFQVSKMTFFKEIYLNNLLGEQTQ